MHREPDSGFIGARPIDTVTRMGGYKHIIAGIHGPRFGLILKPKARRTLEQQHPLVKGLIVPETRRACVPRRDDAFDAKARAG